MHVLFWRPAEYLGKIDGPIMGIEQHYFVTTADFGDLVGDASVYIMDLARQLMGGVLVIIALKSL